MTIAKMPVAASTASLASARQSRESTAVLGTPRAARELFDNVMSPFCPGRTLTACPSPQADSLRAAITLRAAAGEPRELIMRDLITVYGDVVRGAPRTSGFGLLAWALPFAVPVLVFAWLIRWQYRVSRPRVGADQGGTPASNATEDPAATPTPAERAILDEHLRRG